MRQRLLTLSITYLLKQMTTDDFRVAIAALKDFPYEACGSS